MSVQWLVASTDMSKSKIAHRSQKIKAASKPEVGFDGVSLVEVTATPDKGWVSWPSRVYSQWSRSMVMGCPTNSGRQRHSFQAHLGSRGFLMGAVRWLDC